MQKHPIMVNYTCTCASCWARGKFDWMKWWSVVMTMLCCLHLSCSHAVSNQSKSLRCWSASHLLSPLSCCLSSVCWPVNCLLYLWTCSLACCRLLFSQSSTSIALALWMAIAKKVLYFYCKPLWTDMQAQPKTKTPLVPAAPTQLWASR